MRALAAEIAARAEAGAGVVAPPLSKLLEQSIVDAEPDVPATPMLFEVAA
jgi:hypothetical protein